MFNQLKAVIFDWAGTIIDHGSRAPIVTFVELFEAVGVPLTEQEARQPMGLEKREHLRAILHTPRIARQWAALHGHPPDEPDVDALFERFLPIQSRVLPRHADVIAGAARVVESCRSSGMKVGSCTGYAAAVMRGLAASAAEDGLKLDTVVCPDEVGAGRPLPWMIFENMRRLGAYPPAAVLKIDDTPVGMQEGANAGVWRVGITLTGNGTGLSSEQLAALSPAQRRARAEAAGRELREAGAQFLADSVADLPPILGEINARLRRGEKP